MGQRGADADLQQRDHRQRDADRRIDAECLAPEHPDRWGLTLFALTPADIRAKPVEASSAGLSDGVPAPATMVSAPGS